MDQQTRIELEAAAFRTLIGHFQKRKAAARNITGQAPRSIAVRGRCVW